MRWLAIFVLAICPFAANAGAWARGEGEVYLSFSTTGAVDGFGSEIPEMTIYGEYGLSQRFTAALDVFEGTQGQTDAALMMLTAHFGADWPVKIGLSAGGGIDRPDGGDYRGTGRIGAHLGYGLPRGWLAMDAYATWSMVLYPPFELPNPDFKADLTFGHRLNDRFTAIAQVQSGKAAGGDAYMKLAPSIAVILGRVQVSLGAVYGLQNDASRKVTLGVSTAF